MEKNDKEIKQLKQTKYSIAKTERKMIDKTVKDFYGRILGKYNKKLNVTKDFYGRLVAKGDQTGLLFKDK